QRGDPRPTLLHRVGQGGGDRRLPRLPLRRRPPGPHWRRGALLPPAPPPWPSDHGAGAELGVAAERALPHRGDRPLLPLRRLLLLGSLNVNFISMPRIAFGLARDRLAPATFLTLDGRGTPRSGLFFSIGLVFLLSTTGSVEWLIRSLTFVSLVIDGAVVLALF